MVFPGKFSTGCFCCRRRKIKCDEGQPSCRRCTIAGIECAGYRKDLLIRSENFRVRQRVLRARPVTERNPSRQILASESTTTNSHGPTPLENLLSIQVQSLLQSPASKSSLTSSQSETSVCVPLYTSLPTPLEDTALAFFVDQHVLKSRLNPLGTGHLEFLPDLYTAAANTSCLKSAVLATAYLSLFNHTGLPCLDIMARTVRSCALRTVHAAIQSYESAATDETLVAIMLLSLFDDIDGNRPSILNPHIQGIRHIMRLRASRPLRSERDRSLFAWAFTQIHIYAFTTAEYRCFDPNWFPASIEEDDYGSHFTLLASKISYFCELAQKATPHNSEGLPSTDAATRRDSDLSTILKAINIQLELDSWIKSLPSDWIAREVPNITDYCVREFNFLTTYASQNLACAWALFHSTLIIFYSSLITCCDRILSCDLALVSEEERSRVETTATMAESNIKNLLSRICKSLPFATGDIDGNGVKLTCLKYKPGCGYLLLWPLTIVANCRYSTTSHIALSTMTLLRIGSAMKLANWISERPNTICFPGSRSTFQVSLKPT
ncbi:hypothetical protein TWF594_009045 [Orbilia oligospora]|nr:hypothetical protein TWF594_009045 [Orbilia oligospora]